MINQVIYNIHARITYEAHFEKNSTFMLIIVKCLGEMNNKMKLLNLNIGIKIDNSNEVIDLILNNKYDIVTLQEVMRKKEDTVFDIYNSSNIIKESTNYKYSFFGPLWITNHHERNGTTVREFGGYTEQGNEVLSNYLIEQANNIFYYKNYSNYIDVTNFKEEDHPRAFVDVILNIDGKMLQVINVHGIWNKGKIGDERTISQSKKILEHVSQDIPCIIAGDFNLLPNTESIQMLNSKMINLIEKYNIKSTRPMFYDSLDKGDVVCDYIFVNDKVKVNNFTVINTEISDHLPLVLDFDV